MRISAIKTQQNVRTIVRAETTDKNDLLMFYTFLSFTKYNILSFVFVFSCFLSNKIHP